MHVAYQENMDGGWMPDSLTKGLIHLIPKEVGNRGTSGTGDISSSLIDT